jgi:hypothetical protein
MNPAEVERFRKVEEIFHAALEQPPGVDRDTLIRERCGADESLRTEIALCSTITNASGPWPPRPASGCRASAPGRP